MYKHLTKIISGFLIIIIFVGITKTVAADGMIIPEPMPIVKPVFPEIKYHIVDVTIDDQYVVTVVNQEFYNPHDTTLHGTYIFPVPEGAVLSNFQVTIDGVEKTAEILDTEAAEELFKESVVNMQDASILQYVDNDLYSCEVSISPESSIQMSLRYEEVLTLSGGMYKYTYTLSTEQYSSKDIDTVSVNVDIKNDKNIDLVYSPSHTISTDRLNEKHVKVSYEETNSRPDTDFELYFSVTDLDFGASMLTFAEENEDFFMLFFNSNGKETTDDDIIPKDIVFVIDTSGSMSGEKIVQAKDGLKWILEKLGQNDRFNIVDFDHDINVFSEEMMTANPSIKQEAMTYADELRAGGSTNINDALLKAVDLLKKDKNSEHLPIMFFLTDGRPTSGITNEQDIVSNVKTANIEEEVDASIFVFGVGHNVNTHLLDKISNQNHGSRVYIEPSEDIETKLIELYSKVEKPLLTDINIELLGIKTENIYPQTLPDLYEGSELVIVGKYKLDNVLTSLTGVNVRITGKKANEDVTFEYTFNLDSESKNSFIPRIWATRRIGYLMDQIKLEGDSEEIREEIKELGIKYGIVTPYTSVLVKEQKDGVTYGMSEAQEDRDHDGVADAWATVGGTSNKQSEANQEYLFANAPSSTSGANIQSKGKKVFADINGTQIDMRLLEGTDTIDLEEENLQEWVVDNLKIDNIIDFGSDEYFKLIQDEEFTDALSAGTNVIFEINNESYYIQEGNLTVESNLDPIPPKDDDPEKQKTFQTPGFELITLMISLAAVIILAKRK